jgi:microcystin-dependent protein
MSSPFIAEIRMFGGNFAPQGWAFCHGQIMAIAQNNALFALIGTTYGGDGVQTFGLPNLQGRFPLHQGGGFVIGQSGGSETVILTASQLPSHIHTAIAASEGNSVSPQGAFWSTDPGGNTAAYTSPENGAMRADAIGAGSVAQGHDNMQPFLAINFIIALFGVFPSQN